MSITIWNASLPVDNVTPPDKSPQSPAPAPHARVSSDDPPEQVPRAINTPPVTRPLSQPSPSRGEGWGGGEMAARDTKQTRVERGLPHDG
jgi:hypothetical protein